MKPGRRRIDVNLDELDKLLDGARQAPLSEADYDKLKGALHALAAMMVRPRTSEKTSAVVEETAAGETSSETAADSETSRTGHGRSGARAYAGAEKVAVAHPELSHGDRCPECGKGNVYEQKEPKVLVRIVDRRRWQPRFTRSSDCAAALADRYSPHRNRRAWVRKSTMKRRRP